MRKGRRGEADPPFLDSEGREDAHVTVLRARDPQGEAEQLDLQIGGAHRAGERARARRGLRHDFARQRDDEHVRLRVQDDLAEQRDVYAAAPHLRGRDAGAACCITFCVIVSCNVFVTSHLLEICNAMQQLRTVSILSAKIHRCNTHTKILRVADKLRLSQPGFETRLKDAYCTHIAMAFLV